MMSVLFARVLFGQAVLFDGIHETVIKVYTEVALNTPRATFYFVYQLGLLGHYRGRALPVAVENTFLTNAFVGVGTEIVALRLN